MMAVDISLRAMSLQLYHFLCQHVVGTEETVRTRRLMCTISDNLHHDKHMAIITSGSFGEGLVMEDSDLDMMFVLKQVIVHEDKDNIKLDPIKINVIMEKHDTNSVFTKLRAVDLAEDMYDALEQRGNSWYVSSELFKLMYLKNISCAKIHGPCLSSLEDTGDTLDLALCFHNPHWIQVAENWISRGLTSLPSRDVKSEVIDRGVLFVPIGCKGSVNETLEWRISFSVAEKLLIYSFSHTQLLCYALMKILLKDVINSNINCKNLICSYFIKTIIFWVSEETPVTEWKPENLIQCFMRCFRRLLYCVEYSMCPHYFIPNNNMFENKIEKQPRKMLLEHLNTLFSFGWRCVLFSKQFQNFTIYSNALPNTSGIKSTQFRFFFASYIFYMYQNSSKFYITPTSYRKCIQKFNVYKSPFIKLVYLYSLSRICSKIKIIVTPPDRNKNTYSQRREHLACHLQSIHLDALSGWVRLAVFFYKTKQYSSALYILSYALMKCTPEKLYKPTRLSQIQLNLTTSTTLQRLGIFRVLKFFYVDSFDPFFELIPEELELDRPFHLILPPVAFCNFLCFLCHYHLNDIQQCYTCIRDLQITIDEQYFIANNKEKGVSIYLLGVALQLVGQRDLAIGAFMNATRYHCKVKYAAAKRLSMMYMHRDG